MTQLWFYVPLDTQQVISETFPKPISWLGMEKLNLTQQKHTFTNQKKCTKTQKKYKKLKPRNGQGLFLFQRFINMSLSYLVTNLPGYLQTQDPHGAQQKVKTGANTD